MWRVERGIWRGQRARWRWAVTCWQDAERAKRLGSRVLIEMHAVGEVPIFEQVRAVGMSDLQVREPHVATCVILRVANVPPARQR